MMFVGNYVFIRYLGEDGVAAYSIACYFFPIVFMVYNAIAQSAQPILSYNYGAKCTARVRETFRLALTTAIIVRSWCFFCLHGYFLIRLLACFLIVLIRHII